jgi:hypothetical protein
MKLPSLAVTCVFIAVSTTPAAAAAVVAKLQTPVDPPSKFIAGEAMFVCEADNCVALAPTSRTFAMDTCKLSGIRDARCARSAQRR